MAGTTTPAAFPQEFQIALSLACGRRTKETAAALFLSPKTIEYHLRSVYRKLSIGSRSELKAALDRTTTGLPGPTGLQQLAQQGRGPRGAICLGLRPPP